MRPVTIQGDEADSWLEAFAACVRERDLDAGRDLFAPDAVGFGTVAETYVDRGQLIAEQWSDVWPRTEDFTFTGSEHRWLDEDLCAVAATWRSVGLEPNQDGNQDGSRRTRTGRATIVLKRTGDSLVAVHSHFSMTPGTPA